MIVLKCDSSSLLWTFIRSKRSDYSVQLQRERYSRVRTKSICQSRKKKVRYGATHSYTVIADKMFEFDVRIGSQLWFNEYKSYFKPANSFRLRFARCWLNKSFTFVLLAKSSAVVVLYLIYNSVYLSSFDFAWPVKRSPNGPCNVPCVGDIIENPFQLWNLVSETFDWLVFRMHTISNTI